MANEATHQTNVIKYLKSKGCYVIKTKPGAGTPKACPDVVFFKEGLWGMIECKASKTAKSQPGQDATIKKMDDWSWARKSYPAVWPAIRAELEEIL